ncbi:MAG: acyl carrier protein [Bacteroidales bacterium]|nr:acyl carrier protein [Bacteroidales bacterium]
MELTSKILSIISQDAGCGKTIRPEDRIVEDLKVDSLDKLMIIHDLEDEFNITVDEDDLRRLRVVQDIIDAVGRKIPVANA